ncbi:hypothetical protein L2E82_14683 [Cichorium intybus]|uniref:Uncharacterized protein n=1 Tax=Cichorium intybus TaxID=13427 RepID=A0ACB9F0P2_CICIN|nr:hypothetical protein L2E82_14683 [Cichorium intybus]
MGRSWKEIVVWGGNVAMKKVAEREAPSFLLPVRERERNGWRAEEVMVDKMIAIFLRRHLRLPYTLPLP